MLIKCCNIRFVGKIKIYITKKTPTIYFFSLFRDPSAANIEPELGHVSF